MQDMLLEYKNKTSGTMKGIKLIVLSMCFIVLAGCQSAKVQRINAAFGLNTVTIEGHEIKVPVGYAELSRSQTQKMLKGAKEGFAYLKGYGENTRLEFPMIFYTLYRGTQAKNLIIAAFNGEDVLIQYIAQTSTPAQRTKITDYHVSKDRKFCQFNCSFFEPISGIEIREICYLIQHKSNVVLLTNRTAGDADSLQHNFYAFAQSVKDTLEK